MDPNRPIKIEPGLQETSSPSKDKTSPDKSLINPVKVKSSPKNSPDKHRVNTEQQSDVSKEQTPNHPEQLSPEESIDRCRVNEHTIDYTAYVKYPGNYWNKNYEFNAQKFRKSFTTKIHRYERGKELEIDLIGIGPAIANAYRRIMIAEVPTMAIEHCFINQNTSVIQDEMLAHRLGMIPLKVDPSKFSYKSDVLPPLAASDVHTIVFHLKVKCEKLMCESNSTGRRQDLYKNYKVYSRHLTWDPIGKQEKDFADAGVIRPVHKNILIAKLADKQEIDLFVHANKGIGRDHAKFSPVATATYRLMPDIQLKEKIDLKDAVKLQKSFSKGVIEISGPNDEAKVVKPRVDSGSRNFFRHANLKNKVKYDLIKDYYIFRVESVGAIPAVDILLQSCDILGAKCDSFLHELRFSRDRINQPTTMVEGV